MQTANPVLLPADIAIMEHLKYKAEAEDEIAKLRQELNRRRTIINDLDYDNHHLAHGTSPQQPYAGVVTVDPKVEAQNRAKLDAINQDNQRLYALISDLNHQVELARKSNQSMTAVADNLTGQLQALRGSQFQTMAQTQGTLVTSQPAAVSMQSEIIQTKTDNMILTGLLEKIQKEMVALSQRTADAEVQTLRTPEMQTRRLATNPKQTTGTNPGARVIGDLLAVSNKREEELMALKQANIRLRSDNKYIQFEIDHIGRLLESLRASSKNNIGIANQATSSVDIVGTTQPLLRIQETTTAFNPIVPIQAGAPGTLPNPLLTKQKIAEYENDMLPKLEATLRQKDAIINDLERRKFTDNQLQAANRPFVWQQEIINEELIREFDRAESDNIKKSRTVVQ